jgi:hypothetical protein
VHARVHAGDPASAASIAAASLTAFLARHERRRRARTGIRNCRRGHGPGPAEGGARPRAVLNTIVSPMIPTAVIVSTAGGAHPRHTRPSSRPTASARTVILAGAVIGPLASQR